jgi:hypothetical protein
MHELGKRYRENPSKLGLFYDKIGIETWGRRMRHHPGIPKPMRKSYNAALKFGFYDYCSDLLGDIGNNNREIRERISEINHAQNNPYTPECDPDTAYSLEDLRTMERGIVEPEVLDRLRRGLRHFQDKYCAPYKTYTPPIAEDKARQLAQMESEKIKTRAAKERFMNEIFSEWSEKDQ